MADFVAVLRKTLDGLDDPTPDVREKVYAKARLTIAAKLSAINPPPPASVIERQKAALEKAIAEIEAGYDNSVPAPSLDDDPLAEFVSGAAFGTPVARTPPSGSTVSATAPAAAEPAPEPAEPEPAEPGAPSPADLVDAATQGGAPDPAARSTRKPRERRGSAGLIAALIVILLLAGAGYAVWQNKEDFARMAGLEHLLPGAGDVADDQAMDEAAADTTEAGDQTEATESTEEAAAASNEEPKFTQRLLADGSEVDPGPAGGEPTIGEGTSVAAAVTDDTAAGGTETQPGTEEAAAVTEEEPGVAGEDAEETGAAVSDNTALPVGQRAIFYEERTLDLQGSAEPGAVVWSLVQESPGGNLPPEAAIRAEATIPGKDLQFRMTIRRNGDESLPASHIIEMIFITPDDFEGGGIENVLRITFKDTEQSAGNPLLGIPAKISDGFFLLALTDSKADIEANNTMMRRLDWLDIPIVYSSGRRALITMEKGVPGAKVFDDALKAWAPESSG